MVCTNPLQSKSCFAPLRDQKQWMCTIYSSSRWVDIILSKNLPMICCRNIIISLFINLHKVDYIIFYCITLSLHVCLYVYIYNYLYFIISYSYIFTFLPTYDFEDFLDLHTIIYETETHLDLLFRYGLTVRISICNYECRKEWIVLPSGQFHSQSFEIQYMNVHEISKFIFYLPAFVYLSETTQFLTYSCC